MKPRRVTVVTGKAAAPMMRELSQMLCARVPALSAEVVTIENNFFGPEITVAGLLTGKDVCEQLAGKDLGDEVLFPATMLRAEGDLFLCGMSPEEMEKNLNVPVRAVRNEGAALCAALLGCEN